MSKSDVKVSEFYMGFLAPVSKVFSQPEQVHNIFYLGLIRDKDVFLFSSSLFYPSTYRVYTVSYLLQIQGNSAVLNRNTILWLSQYPVRTSTSSGQPFMLINFVKAPTYLLRVLQWSPSKLSYHIVSWGGAEKTMSIFGKRSIFAKIETS